MEHTAHHKRVTELVPEEGRGAGDGCFADTRFDLLVPVESADSNPLEGQRDARDVP